MSVTTADGRDEVELFDAPPERRSFSPTDTVRLAVGASLILFGALLAASAQSTISGLEEDLLRAFARLPSRFEEAVLSLAQLVTGVVPTIVFVALLVKRRFKPALLLFAAGSLAGIGMALADSLVLDDGLSQILAELGADNGGSLVDPSFPNSSVLASTTALVTVAAPFLSRRWKRALWSSVGILVVLRLLAVAHPAFDFMLAFGIGLFTGSALLLLFGSPRSEPGPVEMLDALRDAGYSPSRIRRPDDQGDDALRYQFDDRDQSVHDVSLWTADQRDADLLARLYRRIRYRSSEVGDPYSSIKRRVEHEALVMTLADRAGVGVPHVERIGTTSGGSAFLVTASADTRAAVGDDLSTVGLLDDLWRQVGALHSAGVAHRRLALEAMRIDADGRVRLTDFDAARTAPKERERARDVAALLVETALVVGPRAAVDAAVETLGGARIAPALRMLQPLALPAAIRERVKGQDSLLDDLRTEVNRATGEPGLDLADLERVKPRTILIIGASTLAFYSLLPQLANLGDTVDAFGSANFAWIAAVIGASTLTYVFAAISFQGAVADPIPFAPNLRAQLASSFAGLVGPAGAGGFALTTRFLERVGVGAAESGASVAVNAVGGFVVHIVMMVGFFVWAGNADFGGFSLPDSSTLLLVVAVLFACVGLLLLVGPVRRRIFVPALSGLRTALGQVGRVFQDPTRVLGLFGGSAGITITYLIGITASIQAFGGGLSFAQIGAAYLGAVTIATVSPTPGGLGALESAMIAGFTGFGLDAAEAVSATLTFRLATFWLPILPGWLALGWMQRNSEL
ncbi:MAG TPA: flippase-like domain-containing protein [Acidimicrobiales bacterium]|nr:flippase-like domain-containing protein [Acidimicrobiales bacterium]